MPRWKLNDYEFLINPESFNENSKLIGDYPTSLNGTVYSFPTGYETSYSLSSVFYQPRPRKISEFSIDGDYIKYDPKQKRFHVLNKTTKQMKVYSQNFNTLISTVTITNISGGQILGFDYFDGLVDGLALNIYVIITEKDANSTYISSVNLDGKGYRNTVYNKYATAVKLLGGNSLTWLTTKTNGIEQINYPHYTMVKSTTLPTASYISLGYQGLERYDDKFMAVLVNGIEECGVYHLDIKSGVIVNYFSLPEVGEYTDMTYDKESDTYILLSRGSKTVQYFKGNTVALDIYNLDSLIKDNQSIKMIDDLGFYRNVNVTNYSFKRDPEHPYKYTVDLDITKIDRSV